MLQLLRFVGIFGKRVQTGQQSDRSAFGDWAEFDSAIPEKRGQEMLANAERFLQSIGKIARGDSEETARGGAVDTPGIFAPRTLSFSRFSGHSICSMEIWNARIRASTEGSESNGPTELFSRNGADVHTLTSDGGRVYPRPPAGMV